MSHASEARLSRPPTARRPTGRRSWMAPSFIATSVLTGASGTGERHGGPHPAVAGQRDRRSGLERPAMAGDEQDLAIVESIKVRLGHGARADDLHPGAVEVDPIRGAVASRGPSRFRRTSRAEGGVSSTVSMSIVARWARPRRAVTATPPITAKAPSGASAERPAARMRPTTARPGRWTASPDTAELRWRRPVTQDLSAARAITGQVESDNERMAERPPTLG
jgi:hypothetical protein